MTAVGVLDGEDEVSLPRSEVPRSWYDLTADLPAMAPPLDARTGEPVTVADMLRTTPAALVDQELGTRREIEIPHEVREIYAQWRPTPMLRARRLERALRTPARIYYKYEGDAPTGSCEPNSAVPQAYYNSRAGRHTLVADTGGGQWGSAVAFAAALFGMRAEIFMVRAGAGRKPHRRKLIERFGARCVLSPSEETDVGRAVLADAPDHPGSIGVAKSEALRAVLANPSAGYTGGGAANHVCAHQTVIGLEARRQFDLVEDYPDVVIGAVGSGGDLAGLAFPFLGEKLRGGRDVRIVAVEPAACPTLTRGRIAYDNADSARLTPLYRMHTLGHAFVPPPTYAGGLRTHGIAPLVSWAAELGHIEAVAETQTRCFEAGALFLREEGVLAAPEATYAIRGAIDEAVRCRADGVARTILFGLTGHGNYDLTAYARFAAGLLRDDTPGDEVLADGLASIPDLAGMPSGPADRRTA